MDFGVKGLDRLNRGCSSFCTCSGIEAGGILSDKFECKEEGSQVTSSAKSWARSVIDSLMVLKQSAAGVVPKGSLDNKKAILSMMVKQSFASFSLECILL